MSRIGVILAGCGVQDGAEIHEAVLALLAIDRAGAEAVVMAPDVEQAEVVDHLTGKVVKEKRRVLAESARIARGDIRDVRSVRAADLDTVVIVGGYGAAKNLSTFAKDGADCKVDEGVAALLRDMHGAGKPVGALCISPVILAQVFGKEFAPELTIGNDAGAAAAIEAMGGRHFEAGRTDVVVDDRNRFVTSPCYNLPTRIRDVAVGAEKTVQALLAMAASAAVR